MFVLSLSSLASFALYYLVLVRLGLGFLKLLLFIFISTKAKVLGYKAGYAPLARARVEAKTTGNAKRTVSAGTNVFIRREYTLYIAALRLPCRL